MPGKVAQVVWNLKLIGYRQKCPKVADFSYFGIIPMNDSYDFKTNSFCDLFHMEYTCHDMVILV